MANTITKNHSFGEVLDAIKLKNVKACRECWLDDGEEFKEEENDYYFYFDEAHYKIMDSDFHEFEFDTEDYFAEDYMIIYPC